MFVGYKHIHNLCLAPMMWCVLVLAASLAVGYNASIHKIATLSCLLLSTFAGQTQACKPIVRHLVNKHIGVLLGDSLPMHCPDTDLYVAPSHVKSSDTVIDADSSYQ